MSQYFNLNGNCIISSLNNYFMTVETVKNTEYVSDDWGWFIDIDIIHKPFNNSIAQQTNNKYPNNSSTIPTFRSMKSMSNLHDTSFIFEIDNIDNIDNIEDNYTRTNYTKDNYTKSNYTIPIINTVCSIVGLYGIYCIAMAL